MVLHRVVLNDDLLERAEQLGLSEYIQETLLEERWIPAVNYLCDMQGLQVEQAIQMLRDAGILEEGEN